MTGGPKKDHFTIQRLGVRLGGELAFLSTEPGPLADQIMQLWKQTPPALLHASLGLDEARPEQINISDPLSAGWTFVVGSNDPRKREITAAMKRLAERRGMADPSSPLDLDATEAEWADWIQDEKVACARKDSKFPRYLLLAGDPDNLPFRFQSMLGSKHQVGRLDFDSIADLEAYIEKVIRLESAESPIADRSAVFFGTDHGPRDPTYHSLRHMLAPLAERCRDVLQFRTCEVKADQATKARLIEAVIQEKCALLYTASHGACLSHVEPIAARRALNGAVVCHQTADGANWLTAEDIPSGPFLEGGVFFQFACHGYGTPDISDFDRWLPKNVPAPSSTPFVAALPKRLLANPRGPIAYIGHVDSAFVHAFLNPEDPMSRLAWGNRLHPFRHALDQLLKVQPAALAMDEMAMRLVHANEQITDRMARGDIDSISESPSAAVIANAWIYRTDAQNYFVLGDPAARLRIPRI